MRGSLSFFAFTSGGNDAPDLDASARRKVLLSWSQELCARARRRVLCVLVFVCPRADVKNNIRLSSRCLTHNRSFLRRHSGPPRERVLQKTDFAFCSAADKRMMLCSRDTRRREGIKKKERASCAAL